MTKETLDWTHFTRRIIINKPMERIYEAWTKAGHIEDWFLESAKFYDASGNQRGETEAIQKGDHYEWKWHGWNHAQKGEILAANGKDFVKFSFGNAGIVEVVLNHSANGTEIKLIQKEIPDTEEGKRNFYCGCSLGWSFWMTNLKAWLEAGIKLNQTGIDFDQCEVFEYVNA